MITLHRLGHQVEAFELNPDLIFTVEANPDTVITLTTGAKIIVAEPPERVVAAVKAYRVEILAEAMRRAPERHDAVDPARPLRIRRDPRTSGAGLPHPTALAAHDPEPEA